MNYRFHLKEGGLPCGRLPCNKQGEVTDQVTCEALGAGFTSSAKPSTDMCACMGAKKVYTVVKVYNSMKKTAADSSHFEQGTTSSELSGVAAC